MYPLRTHNAEKAKGKTIERTADVFNISRISITLDLLALTRWNCSAGARVLVRLATGIVLGVPMLSESDSSIKTPVITVASI